MRVLALSSLVALAILVTASSATNAASVLETLNVNADGTTTQSKPLTSGVVYLFEASGTCYFKLPYSNLADANWNQDPLIPNSTEWNAERGSLQIVDHFVTWLGTIDGTVFQPHTFSPSHIYRYYITGTGQPLDFYFADVAYGDNSGYLDVAIISVPSTLGDFNDDGFVTAADYPVWRDTFGTLVENFSGADANGNGVVDAVDIQVWRGNFGMTLGSGTSTAIPEPTGLAIAFLGLAGFFRGVEVGRACLAQSN
jgi:hypothetical protein